MTRYLISFDAHAMDHIPQDDMPAVGAAAHAVLQEAVNAGVWVIGAGLQAEPASVVAPDGTITTGRLPDALGGFAIVDLVSRDEALGWAARFAVACRCAQDVRRLMPDPEQDRMIEAVARR